MSVSRFTTNVDLVSMIGTIVVKGIFITLVLPVGDNWSFRIYLTESLTLSYNVS